MQPLPALLLASALGAAALLFNTTGFNNTAIGADALLNNVDGALNNAHGGGALFSNTSSCCNNAFGDEALSNSTGFGNTAIGDLAGRHSPFFSAAILTAL